MHPSSNRARPRRTTWLAVSCSGLSSTGFASTHGTARAASACKYGALPISPISPKPPKPPSSAGTTRALLPMFCAFNGATRRPRRAAARHKAVVNQLFPAPLVQPRTMSVRGEPDIDDRFDRPWVGRPHRLAG